MNAPAPHIYTLTGNLLAERTQDFAAWNPGKTQRATSQSFQVGGKGINVSKMLTRLGAPNTALLFAGGATGAECTDWLRANRFVFHAFPSSSESRSGLVVRAPAQPETTFLGPDSPPDIDSLRACAVFLDTLPDGVALAFCGSFPGWDSAAAQPLRDVLDRLVHRAIVCVDTYGAPLSWFVDRPASLVKINREEFDRLFTDAERPLSVSSRLLLAKARWPVQRWVITDGPHEVTFVDHPATDSTPPSPPSSLQPPLVEEISPTGSGDVLFACVLHARHVRSFTLADSISFALPFASANAASRGIADFPMN